MPLPQTEIPGRLQMQLAERGIRMTAPRRAILTVIETATKHLDAAQILRKARTIDSLRSIAAPSTGPSNCSSGKD